LEKEFSKFGPLEKVTVVLDGKKCLKSTDIDGLFFDRPEDPVDSRLSILRLRKTLKRARMP